MRSRFELLLTHNCYFKTKEQDYKQKNTFFSVSFSFSSVKFVYSQIIKYAGHLLLIRDTLCMTVINLDTNYDLSTKISNKAETFQGFDMASFFPSVLWLVCRTHTHTKLGSIFGIKR